MPEKAVEMFIDGLLRRRRGNSDFSLFAGLSEGNLQNLLSNSRMQDFDAGREIIRQGDMPAYLYYIIGGAVKTLRHGGDGQEATIRMMETGATFMDAAIFMDVLSPVTAIAIENSKLLCIPADIVRIQALSDAHFACNLLRIVTSHYKTALQQIDCVMIKNPVERLGYYFLKLHLDQGVELMEISLPFPKSVIASHLGMTPETFSRALGRIKKMGIAVDQDLLTLRDSYVLCHYCDSDTAQACPHFNTVHCALCAGGPQACG